MRLKRPDKNKTESLKARCTENQKNKVQQKANIYCEGNLSEYVLFAALNFVPSKEDFEEDKPKKKRGK